MEKQRCFVSQGQGQMVELFGRVAVGIHDKRHSAPRDVKVLGGRGVWGVLTSLSLQQEDSVPEPVVMWPVVGVPLSGGRE